MYYHMHVAGLERDLPICPVNDSLSIAGFVIFGDQELTVACARELLKKAPEYDYIITAEAKGIPLAHEMSRQSGKPYVCARKGIKLYMSDPVVVEDQSITTAGKQKLVIDRKELDKMNGKRVLVVDDVISTGGSLKALDALAEQTKCTIVGQAAVLAELGQQSPVDDLLPYRRPFGLVIGGNGPAQQLHRFRIGVFHHLGGSGLVAAAQGLLAHEILLGIEIRHAIHGEHRRVPVAEPAVGAVFVEETHHISGNGRVLLRDGELLVQVIAPLIRRQ